MARKCMGRPKGTKGTLPVDENGHNSRDRRMILGHARSEEGQTRGYRALRQVCEALGIDPLTVQRLRGDAMRRLQWAWTDEMRRLATSEASPFPWNPSWDKPTRSGPVYEFHRSSITNGEHERQTHDPEERTAA